VYRAYLLSGVDMDVSILLERERVGSKVRFELAALLLISLQQEKQRWLLRKDEIQQNAETFGKVSPLLSWFAHRVTTHIMKDDDTDEEEEAALEEGALVKREVTAGPWIIRVLALVIMKIYFLFPIFGLFVGAIIHPAKRSNLLRIYFLNSKGLMVREGEERASSYQ
jgi:hypothetical protein